jgi:Zn-dependent metalloprotease
MHHCRTHGLHCVLPPIVLQNIARNGDDEQRAWATQALSRDASIRLARVQNALAGVAVSRDRADALVGVATPRPARVISDANESEDVRGPIVRREGEPDTGDQATDEAYAGLGDTFDFFLAVYGRNSIDEGGMPLRGVVHFGDDYPNAFWDGQRMVFGNGDGKVLGLMTRSLDVIGHELGHGVTEKEAGLEYFGQSGALNESLSDVWGSLVKQYKLHQDAAAADWMIGKDVWTPAIAGDALRSLKAPGEAYDDPLVGKDPQPANMDQYLETIQDNGGVHTNSGIPNHAFYLAATKIGGYAWEVSGRIWYEALRHPALKTNSGFSEFARLTIETAERLHGRDSAPALAVAEAWENVGVDSAQTAPDALQSAAP